MITALGIHAPFIVGGRRPQLLLFACWTNEARQPYRRCLLVVLTTPGTSETPRAALVPAVDNAAAAPYLMSRAGLTVEEAGAILALAKQNEAAFIDAARALPFIPSADGDGVQWPVGSPPVPAANDRRTSRG